MTDPVLLFCRERFTAELPWTGVEPLLPGWEIRSCRRGDVARHLDGIDVLCPFGAVIDAAILEAGGFGLVHQYGVGLEKVDIPRATELGVWVARVPGELGGNASGVAEIAVLFVLALRRRLDEARAALEGDGWNARPTGWSLDGATVAVVGLGAIGVAVAERLAPFGTRLLAVRANPDRGGLPVLEQVVGPDRFEDVLGQADVVICCADGSSGRLFGERAFAAMKSGAIFVNVARGGLVDEPALLAALDSGHLAGAGLDVHAVEPADPRSALLSHPNVLATPHVGGLTDVMFRRTGEAFADSLRHWAAGNPPLWPANAPAFRRPLAG
jgi:phosphoglycerate dehydrogenase-like enzyme